MEKEETVEVEEVKQEEKKEKKKISFGWYEILAVLIMFFGVIFIVYNLLVLMKII